nr:unnamed protein product [Callosobruchus analis]CAI5859509.1 unnamed protein product [Callosobruchus analis]
MVQNCWDQTR